MPYQRPIDDPWSIPNPKPGRHYRWLAADPRRLSLWLRSYGDIPGYSLVQGKTKQETISKAEELGYDASWVDANNRISFGHNVLADIPVEEYHRRTKERIDEQLDKINEATNKVYELTEPVKGVEPFIEHPDETQARKEFSKREDRPFSGQAGRGKSPNLKSRKQPTS